jgi:hypothetical protein
VRNADFAPINGNQAPKNEHLMKIGIVRQQMQIAESSPYEISDFGV